MDPPSSCIRTGSFSAITVFIYFYLVATKAHHFKVSLALTMFYGAQAAEPSVPMVLEGTPLLGVMHASVKTRADPSGHVILDSTRKRESLNLN